MEQLKLNSGTSIPITGFGTWQLTFHTKRKVLDAIQTGYRLIDTAKVYRNEDGVGEAVQASAVPRQELFITTKLWNGDQGHESAIMAFEGSLSRLRLSYIDLYLIHWPAEARQTRLGSWSALVALYKSGRAKSIGVSNYYPEQIVEMIEATGVVPAVNQIEFHPFVYAEQAPTMHFCQERGIVIEAYSPLARGHDLNHPVISAIAERAGKTNAQVMLRWCIQHGTVPIPKTGHPERMRENLAIFDFSLSPQDMSAMNKLG